MDAFLQKSYDLKLNGLMEEVLLGEVNTHLIVININLIM